MTRETRIGLLVGLVFIIMFGMVLSEFTRSEDPPNEAAGRDESPDWTDGVERVVPTRRGESPVASVGEVVAESSAVVAQMDMRPPEQGRRGVAVSHMIVPLDQDATTTATTSTWGGELAALVAQPAAPAPPAVAIEPYTVQPNDSLIKIARKVYGRGCENEYRRIFEANRATLSDESTVVPGQVLKIPPLPQEVDLNQLAQRFAGPAGAAGRSRRFYVVRDGDNLTRIARRELNDDSDSAVQKIYRANRGKLTSPDRLTIGQKLEIPS